MTIFNSRVTGEEETKDESSCIICHGYKANTSEGRCSCVMGASTPNPPSAQVTYAYDSYN